MNKKKVIYIVLVDSYIIYTEPSGVFVFIQLFIEKIVLYYAVNYS